MKKFLSLNNFKNKKRKGFTLVELIVVIAILAILAAVAIPAYNNVQQSAQISAATSDGKLVVRSLNMYNSLAKTKLTDSSPNAWTTKYSSGVLALKLQTSSDDMVDMDLSLPIDATTYGYLTKSGNAAVEYASDTGFSLNETKLKANVTAAD